MRFKWNGERRGYRFKDKDKLCDAIRTMLEDEGASPGEVHATTGVAAQTVHNWTDGPTRMPQNACVMAVTNIYGYARRDVLDKDGSIVPALVKLRRGRFDVQAEREAQADYWVKQGKPKKKKRARKKKANGHA